MENEGNNMSEKMENENMMNKTKNEESKGGDIMTKYTIDTDMSSKKISFRYHARKGYEISMIMQNKETGELQDWNVNLKEHFEDEEYNLIRVECNASNEVEILQNQIDEMNDFIRQTRIDLFERTAINREDLNAMRENHAELQVKHLPFNR